VRINVNVEAAFDGSTWQTPREDIVWTNITPWVEHSTGVTINRGRSGRYDEVRAGTCTLTLIDSDRTFDPENTAGDYYGFLNPGVPLRVTCQFGGDVLEWGGEEMTWGGDTMTWGAEVHPRFHGFIEDWPQSSPDPADRRVFIPIEAVDAFGMLALGRQRSVLENEIVADSPYAYWPLDETNGTVMRDRSGNVRDGEFTVGTTGLAQSAGIVFDGEHVGTLPDPLPTDGDSVAIEATIDLTGVELVNGDRLAICELAGADVTHYFAVEVMDADARSVRLNHGYSWLGGLFPDEAYSAEFIADRPRHVAIIAVAVTIVSPSPQRSYFLDGVEIPGSGFDAAAPDYTGVATGMRVGGSKANGVFLGVLADVAVYSGSLSSGRIAVHAAAALTPLDGDTTDERIEYLLDAAGFPTADRNLTTGYTTLGTADHDGEYTLDLIRRVEKTEQGRFFISKAGDATFDARYHGQLVETIPSATFSDDGSDVGYSNVEVVRPRSAIFNKITVTADGQSPVTVEDATSITAHGEREVSIDAPLLPSSTLQRSLGEYVLTNSKDPQPRVTGLSVPLHKDFTTLAPLVLPLEQGDRVNFERTPVNTGATIDWDQIVEGYTERFDTTTWTWTPQLSPAEPVTFCTWGGTGDAHEWGTGVWGY
jgi:hypothetical protein